jgi:hypothetical protein
MKALSLNGLQKKMLRNIKDGVRRRDVKVLRSEIKKERNVVNLRSA